MTTRRFHLHLADPGETIRVVNIWSDTDRGRSTSDYYVIKAGVASETGTTYVGEWDQSKKSLTARKTESLTGSSDLNYPLRTGDICIVEVSDFGADVASIEGVTVEFKGDVVGGVRPDPASRDGLGHRYEINRPLVKVTGTARPDLAVQELEDAANTVLRPRWRAGIPIPAPDTDT